MPGTVKITVKGLREVTEALRKLGPELAEQAGDSALRAMGKPIITAAQGFAPKRTGNYAKNIAFTLDRKAAREGQRKARIGVRAPYSRIAHLLEFGTVKMSAKPHLRPALDGQADHAIRKGGEALGRQISNIARKLARGAAVRKVR